MSLPKMAEAIGLSVAGVRKVLDKLKASGRIRRVGPDKGGYRPSKIYASRIPRLMDLGLLEKVERGHYVLSRKYYIQKGEPGIHTRRVGLIAEECKALIEKHIRLSGNRGVPIKEFLELLSGTPSRRISYFLDQMKRIGKLRAEGRGRGALWFLIEQKQGESNNFQVQNRI